MCDCCCLGNGQRPSKNGSVSQSFGSLGISRFPMVSGAQVEFFFGRLQKQRITKKHMLFVHLSIAKKKKNTFEATHTSSPPSTSGMNKLCHEYQGDFQKGPECSKKTAQFVAPSLRCLANLHTMPFHGGCYTRVLNS